MPHLSDDADEMYPLVIEVSLIRILPDRLPQAFRMLDPGERDRMEGFHFERDRLRYAISHGAMRAILATYVDVAPEHIAFQTGSSGKPEIAGSRVGFNLSHSGDWACLAVGRDCELGVDIEKVQAMAGADELFARYASCEEQACAARLCLPPAGEMFFVWWTRKEALLKGLGCGITAHLPGLTAWRGSDGLSRFGDWSILSLDVATGYRAGLAVRAPEFTVNLREFQW